MRYSILLFMMMSSLSKPIPISGVGRIGLRYSWCHRRHPLARQVPATGYGLRHRAGMVPGPRSTAPQQRQRTGGPGVTPPASHNDLATNPNHARPLQWGRHSCLPFQISASVTVPQRGQSPFSEYRKKGQSPRAHFPPASGLKSQAC